MERPTDEEPRPHERGEGPPRRAERSGPRALGGRVEAAGGSSILDRTGRAAAVGHPSILKPLPPERFRILGSNAEMRWEGLRGDTHTVPNDSFFVRNHTATPLIDADAWRLRLFGSGLRGEPGAGGAVEFTYEELLALPARQTAVAIECAGNGRSFFESQQGSPAEGTRWRLGGIGVARWRGVPLSDVLDRAGIDVRRAVDLMPQGLDGRVVTG
ncbi:MAG: hypothetical protein QOK40_430, partial [Miltoncostaeaceae bacterium]|nr:hypothetical protein [Miltoncostaeaceae bacterium]